MTRHGGAAAREARDQLRSYVLVGTESTVRDLQRRARISRPMVRLDPAARRVSPPRVRRAPTALRRTHSDPSRQSADPEHDADQPTRCRVRRGVDDSVHLGQKPSAEDPRANPEVSREEQRMVSPREEHITKIEPLATNVWCSDMIGRRCRDETSPVAECRDPKEHVGVLADAADAGEVGTKSAEFQKNRCPERHVRTDPMLYVFRFAGVGSKVSGQLPIWQEHSNGFCALIFFARPAVERPSGNGTYGRVVERAADRLRPSFGDIHVIVNEGDKGM